MKGSGSRDKYSKQVTNVTENKLMKTAVQPTTTNKMQKTDYNRPASGKQLNSQKNIPTKVVKNDYNVQDNMTESRIHEAKQGLQLLKKKMSAKGVSREKITPSQKIIQEKINIKPSSNQKIESYEKQNSNNPPRKIEKKAMDYQQQVPKKLTPKIPMKKTATKQQHREEKKQNIVQREEYRNIQEQIPIKPKKDFNTMLEEQLRKQQKYGSQNTLITQNNNQYPNESNMQLVQCSQGCGRMFSTQAILKHQKICQKVFQNKRKAFDSAAHRAPESEGFDKPSINKKNTQTLTKTQSKPQPKQAPKGAIPKWKAQSLAFRANMKQAKGGEISKEQKEAMAAKDSNMVVCNYCGRKFSDTAGARHIPFCQTKSKNIAMKKK